MRELRFLRDIGKTETICILHIKTRNALYPQTQPVCGLSAKRTESGSLSPVALFQFCR